MNERLGRALRPDAQAFDEVRIVTVPRFKTSGLSGDEWRISAKMQFFRKGAMIYEASYHNVETALGFGYAEFHRAIDEGKAYFAGIEDLCDQEGCAEKAVVTYRRKKEFSRDNPDKWNGPPHAMSALRCFCSRHSKRGDCAFDDADANYELIEGQPGATRAEDESPSAFGGVVDLSDKG